MSGKKDKKGFVGFMRKLVLFFRDDRIRIVFGIFLVLFAAYMLIAFVSYFFTWKEDQDFLWADVFSGPDVVVENHSGKLGAWLSALFINRWFGLGSLTFPFILLAVGIKSLGVTLFNTGRSVRNLLISAILISVTLGFIAGSQTSFLGSGPGGAHGYFIAQWIKAILGTIGTALALFLTIFVFAIFGLKVPISVFKKNPGPPGNEEDNTIPLEDEEPVEQELHVVNPMDEPDPGPEPLQDHPVTSETGRDMNPEEEKDLVGLTVENTDDDELEFVSTIEEDYDPTLDLAGYKYPPLSILKEYESGNPTVSNEELISNKNKIVETLANYKITIDKIKATIGPTVTLYEIVPAPGIRISKIKSLEDDIALSLSALGIRIIAPIPGKGTIGIEVPNQQPRTVSMKNVLGSAKFQDTKFDLPVALGKTISNETYVFDLTRMPHLLVAGATGQGKSVGLNAIITSLLYKKHPSQLKFVLVDPKKVELTLYSKLERHFLAKLPGTEEAIITDTQKVINTLSSLTVEMDTRYNLLKLAHVRNIKEYNEKFIKRRLNPEKGHRYLPYIVLVIDEFADLIMTAGRDVEGPIARLAQLARAIGIHLIIATQRPTTNIITGVIKANFPARIAFRVMSVIDSRTILDMSGANQLIGRGDMLISAGNEPVRLQCAFIDTPEIDELTAYIGDQRGYPDAFLLPEVEEENSDAKEIDLRKRDDKFEDAARLVVQFQQGSTSLIQRKLSLGYNRAGRIVDQLEAAGILGPFEGSKARDVRVHDEATLEQILNSLNKD